MEHPLKTQWLDLRERMLDSVNVAHTSMSIRVPGGTTMWLGKFGDPAPQVCDWAHSDLKDETRDTHATIYRSRQDVGAILLGGSKFGSCLADFEGRIPLLFDEQARHLGWMGYPAANNHQAKKSLNQGGNCMVFRGLPVCLGSTATRMAMNAELFEKCAKAYVLATATGQHLSTLPWWVAHIATRRLKKDQKAAGIAFAAGQMPVETKGY